MSKLQTVIINQDAIDLDKADDLSCGLSMPDKMINGSKYTHRDRIKAVSLYTVVGSLRHTARLTGMPLNTLRYWHRADWWADLVNKVRLLKSDLLEAQTDSIIDLAFENARDRLQRGDPFVDKNQVVRRKPVTCKDSATVFGIMFDKRQINRSMPTTISQHTHTHLIDLKQQFDTLTTNRAVTIDSSD